MNEGTTLLNSKELLALADHRHLDFSLLIRHFARLAADDDGGSRCGTSVLVGRYIEHLNVYNHHTPRTRKRIEGVLRRFCLVFGDLDPDSLSQPLAASWIKRQGWAPSTQTWVALLLERCVAFGVKRAGVRRNRLHGLQSQVLERLCGADVAT